jgi:hypothetical protein
MTTKDIKNWYKNCKSKLVIGFGGKCCICGYDKCIDAFDLHHIDPNKKSFNICSYKIKNWDVIKEEAKKCVLLCATCHREFHAGFTKLPLDAPRFKEELIPFKEKIIYNCLDCGIELLNKETKRCLKCNGIKHRKFEISKDELENLVNNYPLTKIAEMYNVSDKAIEKRCKKLKVALKGRGYWSMVKKNL